MKLPFVCSINKGLIGYYIDSAVLLCLHMFMECTADNVHLLFLSKVDELNCISRYTDGEVSVLRLFRMLHSVDQLITGEYVDINVVSTILEVSIQGHNQVRDTLLFVVTKSVWVYGLCIRDTVKSELIRNLSYRVKRS